MRFKQEFPVSDEEIKTCIVSWLMNKFHLKAGTTPPTVAINVNSKGICSANVTWTHDHGEELKGTSMTYEDVKRRVDEM
ncbi:MAG: hypothetical protein ACYTEQ_12360 [Planctomycetota bacterium]|jgi:hypothetical protein